MQKLLLTILLGSCVGAAFSCDVCGCAPSGFNSGISAFNPRHYVGLSYAARSFTSQHPVLFEGETPSHSEEQFHTLSIIGRYSPAKYIQLSAAVPYQFLQKLEQGAQSTNSGLGDIQLLGQFVLNSAKNDSTNYAVRFSAGAGIKAPTGKSRSLIKDPLIIPAMQLGSGSWDGLFTASLFQRVYKSGVSLEGFYRMNQENKSGYQFGNRFLSQAKLMRFVTLGKNKQLSLVPEVGAQFDLARKDYTNVFKNDIQEYSGGYFLDASIGANIFYKNFVMGLTYFTPVNQYYAQGLVDPKPGLNININYIFNSK